MSKPEPTALRSTHITEHPGGHPCDLRFGLLLKNRSGELVSSLYVSQLGHSGMFNGAVIKLKGELYLWLKDYTGQ